MKKHLIFHIALSLLLVGCSSATSTQVGTSSSVTPAQDTSVVCAQVITPAKNEKTGEIKDFPTPCDVPAGWVVISPTSTEAPSKEGSTAAVKLPISLSDSRVTWQGTKPGGKHFGIFPLKEGVFELNSAGELSGGKLVLDMKNLTAEIPAVENHLKNSDFFDVEKFPEALFVARSIRKNNDQYVINGDLTIKDVTRPVIVNATVTSDTTKVTLISSYTLDRTQWGINFKSKNIFKNLGDSFIDDQVPLTFTLVARK